MLFVLLIIQGLHGKLVHNHDNLLGKGMAGKVYIENGKAKKSARIRYRPFSTIMVRREIEYCRRVKDVPNCIDTTDEDVQNASFKMEICQDTLNTALLNKEQRDAFDIKSFMYSMLTTLDILHTTKNIAHMDVKPKNILKCNGSYKLSDFGNARDASKTLRMNFAFHPYSPPEIWSGRTIYPTKVDVFSIGAIIDAFYSEGIRKYKYTTLKQLEFEKDSREDLIKWMLLKEPQLRPTAAEALAHPFLSNIPYFVGHSFKAALEKQTEKIYCTKCF